MTPPSVRQPLDDPNAAEPNLVLPYTAFIERYQDTKAAAALSNSEGKTGRAKFTTRITPKMSVSPTAMRLYTPPNSSPLTTPCTTSVKST